MPQNLRANGRFDVPSITSVTKLRNRTFPWNRFEFDDSFG